MNQTVVVTGASGFVGRKLLNKLKNLGCRVIALDIVNPEIDQIEFIHLDIMKQFKFGDISIPPESIFIHLAALSTDSQCQSDPISAIETNLLGTLRVVELANVSGVSKFIFASSEWVYTEISNTDLQDESEILQLEKLNSIYAMTKLMGENLIRVTSLVPTVVLRFGIVFGPRGKPGSAPESIALKIANGEEVEVGSKDTSRRFIFVDDLVEGLMKVCEVRALPSYTIFNLSGRELISLKEIAFVAGSLTGRISNLTEKGHTPSIRNPNPAKFAKEFDFIANTSFKDAIALCLESMSAESAREN